MVDRSAFDRVIQQGGYVSVRTGAAPMLMIRQFEKKLLIWLFKPLLASDAERVLQLVQMHRQCFSLVQKLVTWDYCHRVK